MPAAGLLNVSAASEPPQDPSGAALWHWGTGALWTPLVLHCGAGALWTPLVLQVCPLSPEILVHPRIFWDGSTHKQPEPLAEAVICVVAVSVKQRRSPALGPGSRSEATSCKPRATTVTGRLRAWAPGVELGVCLGVELGVCLGLGHSSLPTQHSQLARVCLVF